MSSTLNGFTQGDLVVSLSGNVGGATGIGDNQASPIELEELTTAGTAVGDMILPETTTVVNGVTENGVSGEYGSSSEGALELSADGHSLVIGGYAVNYLTYNADESGGNNVFGNAALAQSTSVPGGQFTPVARVVADISANGTVDSSTALFNVFNTNNIRSVATVDGSSFYVSGQGVSGDTTQGVFLAQDGASSATAIDSSTDTRTVEIINGTLYVSRDSKQPKNGGTSNISSFGGLPTSGTTPSVLPGISQSITLKASQENGINNSAVGTTVHLSPEAFFFADATTLYVADGGDPKQGGLGDGGLQKWSFTGGAWSLDYTLSAGLPLVPATTSSSGTTGLIGLTGQVVGNQVELFATNSTLTDLGATFVYGVTDQLSDTTLPTTESFTQLFAAPAGTNVRGIAFAPTAACYCAGTLIRTPDGEVPVEALEGREVVALDGTAAPVRWLGRRSYAGRFLRPEMRPIRIAPGALGAGLPRRELRVSPCHAMLIDGLLVPAGELVNGTTITVDTQCTEVAYFHVELPQHDVIWAEGAPSESYLDTGNRWMFHNAAGCEAGEAEDAASCAPRVEDGHALEAIRRRLGQARAAA